MKKESKKEETEIHYSIYPYSTFYTEYSLYLQVRLLLNTVSIPPVPWTATQGGFLRT